eukprot:TRINITY_DN3982_c0_g1_i9.p1 TRINITY_DN3982_c0_g1~~TRINITY_DN3982_c0_g1_i9.p1  ORF type:complete len:107 (-),score=1.29 TRINITY_DN3982_c0_g1_i9:96-416(-)
MSRQGLYTTTHHRTNRHAITSTPLKYRQSPSILVTITGTHVMENVRTRSELPFQTPFHPSCSSLYQFLHQTSRKSTDAFFKQHNGIILRINICIALHQSMMPSGGV